MRLVGKSSRIFGSLVHSAQRLYSFAKGNGPRDIFLDDGVRSGVPVYTKQMQAYGVRAMLLKAGVSIVLEEISQ